MTKRKFQVGDRIRITTSTNGFGGRTGRIVEDNPPLYAVELDDEPNSPWIISETEFELVDASHE